ncbi:helix-turn-helix domain-containing protein [Streptomyces sp. NPDC059515]|uniref:helix-turn-helix domain-containing protein n=1 Tax=Streptomyces sp. NPDC059515 TaxID=3346854 RepID=UPI00368169DE
MHSTVADKIRSRLRVRLTLPTPAECRQIREGAGLTQAAVADAIGVTPQAVALWESGRRTPRGPLLNRYAEAIETMREAL